MIEAIYDRRSIRKYLDTSVSKEDITEIIQSGIKAPSSKNRQPWKYIVMQGEAKQEMIEIFREGVEREERTHALLPKSSRHIKAAKYTADIMAEAPVVIFAINPLGKSLKEELTAEERIYEICNTQSIAASIENMILAATDKGLGSLWICDTYFAYFELCDWLKTEGEPVAAIALGYPAETPHERPRKNIEDVIEWRE